jgi:hypothetical protein
MSFFLNLLLRGLRARFTDCPKYREDLSAWDFEVSDCLAALAVFADAPDREALMIAADDFEEGPVGRRDRMRHGIDCPIVDGLESAGLKERAQIIVDWERIILPHADFSFRLQLTQPRGISFVGQRRDHSDLVGDVPSNDCDPRRERRRRRPAAIDPQQCVDFSPSRKMGGPDLEQRVLIGPVGRRPHRVRFAGQGPTGNLGQVSIEAFKLVNDRASSRRAAQSYASAGAGRLNDRTLAPPSQ